MLPVKVVSPTTVTTGVVVNTEPEVPATGSPPAKVSEPAAALTLNGDEVVISDTVVLEESPVPTLAVIV